MVKGRPLRRLAFGGLTLVLVGAAIFFWTTTGFTYSRGQRVGVVRKLSERGWACKTYEGTLTMSLDASGGATKVWDFSVAEKIVADQIDALLGQRVVLRYEQHKGVLGTCVGETEYFVTGVRRVD